MDVYNKLLKERSYNRKDDIKEPKVEFKKLFFFKLNLNAKAKAFQTSDKRNLNNFSYAP